MLYSSDLADHHTLCDDRARRHGAPASPARALPVPSSIPAPDPTGGPQPASLGDHCWVDRHGFRVGRVPMGTRSAFEGRIPPQAQPVV